MPNSNSDAPIIVWFRQDLRLSDNPALAHAAETGKAVLALYILDEVSEGVRMMGAAQKWWLHHSLANLSKDIEEMGGRLVLQRGAATDVVEQARSASTSDAIVWNRRYGEGEQAVDRAIKSDFSGDAKSFAGMLLHEPTQVRTGSGAPYKVFTPFWKNLMAGALPRKPLDKPAKVRWFDGDIASDALEGWSLLPTNPDWSDGIVTEWHPGEAGAAKRIAAFLDGNIDGYGELRDLPGPDRTSKLSPHLRFGEVSPYQVWDASFSANANMSEASRETWRKEIGWREFSYHLLQEWPDLATENFNEKFDSFPWERNDAHLRAWQTGMTGYPIVDAGMRQLYQTGWMHNRVRMIVASFLVKHLLVDWREGERWFWNTLVDGDPAANPAQWQWVAGSGADAAPYFRIFNPILQAKKFDGQGQYIHEHVPELSNLPAEFLAAPWEAPQEALQRAGVILGETYPNPIVDHKIARERALDALESTKGSH